MDVERAGVLDRLREVGYRRRSGARAPGTWRRRRGRLELRAAGLRRPRAAVPRATRCDRPRWYTVRAIATSRPASGTRGHARARCSTSPGTAPGSGAVPVRLAALPRHVAAGDPRRRGRALLRARRRRSPRRRARLLGRRAGGPRRPGRSTITQQLAKTSSSAPQRTWRRKLREAALAVLISGGSAKDEILELYLNEVYLGRSGAANVVGIGEAARTFFGKAASDLTLGEAATIAGIIHAPNLDSPLRYSGARGAGAARCSHRMARAHFIARAEEAAARGETLRLDPEPAPRRRERCSSSSRCGARSRSGSATARSRRAARRLHDPRSGDAARRRARRRRRARGARADHRWLRGRKTELEGAFVVLDARTARRARSSAAAISRASRSTAPPAPAGRQARRSSRSCTWPRSRRPGASRRRRCSRTGRSPCSVAGDAGGPPTTMAFSRPGDVRTAVESPERPDGAALAGGRHRHGGARRRRGGLARRAAAVPALALGAGDEPPRVAGAYASSRACGAPRNAVASCAPCGRRRRRVFARGATAATGRPASRLPRPPPARRRGRSRHRARPPRARLARPARRQDGHDQRVPRRLVRRVHARSARRRLGRLRRRPATRLSSAATALPDVGRGR